MFLTVLILALSLLPSPARGQASPSLVGAWRLVSFEGDSSGTMRPYWDSRPSGLIVYTADGQVAAQLYDSRRPRSQVPPESLEPEAARALFLGLITYFGKYRVNRAAGTVRHIVEGAMSPEWIGTTLVRAYRFLGPDRIELRVITDETGHSVVNGPVLVWERIR